MEGFCTKEHCTIYGHQVWHYMVALPIGNIHIIDYEGKGFAISRTIINEDNAKAERLFKRRCYDLLNFRYL